MRLQNEYIENSRRVYAGSKNNTSRYSQSNSRATFENVNENFVIEENDPTDPIYTKSGFSVRKPVPGPSLDPEGEGLIGLRQAAVEAIEARELLLRRLRMASSSF